MTGAGMSTMTTNEKIELLGISPVCQSSFKGIPPLLCASA